MDTLSEEVFDIIHCVMEKYICPYNKSCANPNPDFRSCNNCDVLNYGFFAVAIKESFLPTSITKNRIRLAAKLIAAQLQFEAGISDLAIKWGLQQKPWTAEQPFQNQNPQNPPIFFDN